MLEGSLARLGRRLRLGLIGGGGNSFIGGTHRIAARLDDCFEICAGVLSSDPSRSVAQASQLGIPRGYADVASMLASEANHPEGIDAVAIMTPNDSHHSYAAMALDAGLDVICDKPLTNDLETARDLVRQAEQKGLSLTVTYNYSGYPMIREARAMVAAGEIGTPRLVHVAYVQGSLGQLVENEPDRIPSRLKWRLDRSKGGQSHVLADIGSHMHHLVSHVSGQEFDSVLADLGAALPGREAHDTGSIIFRLTGGARGVMFVTKAATGMSNGSSIEIYGEGGGICWAHENAEQLVVRRPNRPAELRTRGLPSLHPLGRRGVRLPMGHPEGFLEGFANVYADFAELVAARRTGTRPDPLALHSPDGRAGARTLAFIEACIESSGSGGWVKVPAV